MSGSVAPRVDLAFLLAALGIGLTTSVAEMVAASPAMTVSILGLAGTCCSVILLTPVWVLAHLAGYFLPLHRWRRKRLVGLATLIVALLLSAFCASGLGKPYLSRLPIAGPVGTGSLFLAAFFFLLPAVARRRLRARSIAVTLGVVLAWAGALAATILVLNADPVARFRAFERAPLLGPQLRILDSSLDLFSPMLRDVPLATREALAPLQPVPVLDPPDPWHHPNILLITIDALRGDTVPPGRGSPLRVPTMASLAARGIVFSRAYCSGCMTAHSSPALLMGKYSGQLALSYVRVGDDLVVDPTDSATRVLDLRKVGLVPIHDRSLTLAATLARGGYQTAAVIAYVMFLPAAGITRDFEIVDDAVLRSPGVPGDRASTPEMTARAIEVIRHRDRSRPLFFWMHYLDPHQPYLASPVGDGDAEYNRYLGEIETVDRGLGELLDAVAREGMADNTLVILTSDHGEAFGEHGGEVHGRRLYEENVHVPLIIVPPGRAQIPARIVDVPVRGVDLPPTIAELAGVSFPSNLAGRSLAPTILRGESPQRRPILIECFRYGGEARSLLDGSLKLIDNARSGVLELYDLASDPHEQHNLIAARSGDAARMMGLLRGAEALLALRPLPRPHAQSSAPAPDHGATDP